MSRLTYIAQIAAGSFGEYEQRGHSVSGCGTLEDMLAAHAGEMAPGCWIVDGRAIPFEIAAHESISGPMVDGSLTTDAPRFDMPAGPLTTAIVAGFGMSGLAARQSAAGNEPGPFDSISPETAARRWAKVGARVGQWDGTTVRWET